MPFSVPFEKPESQDMVLRILDTANGAVQIIDGKEIFPPDCTKQGCILLPNIFTLVTRDLQ